MRGRRGLRIGLGVLGIFLVVVIVAAPPVIGLLLEQGLRAAAGDDGASSEVDSVSFAWPARLHVEGFRLRLAAADAPAMVLRSLDVRIAPLRWLVGHEFLEITIAGPRVVLNRGPEGTYDLFDRLRGAASSGPKPPSSALTYDTQIEPDDSVEPEYDPAAETRVAEEPRDADTGADPAELPSIDGSLWTRIDDPFTVLHGGISVTDGELLIVDPAAGARTELRDVTITVRVRTDEVIAFDVAARQRGRGEGEGAIRANGHIVFSAGERFWYDPAETLRRIELDAEARLAPCTVGDVDLGGELRAAVHDGQATLSADGVLNDGTASARIAVQVAPRSDALTGDLNVELRNVGLCSAFAPILAEINPIFDVGNGTLTGRLDTAWSGGWAATPTGKTRAWRNGRLEVKALRASGAPLTVALLDWLGEPGSDLAGDMVAPDIRSENGRLSYDRMALAGRDRDLTFAGTIAEDGVLRLTCEASAGRSAAGVVGVGAPLRASIVGWVDEPRLRR